MKKVTYGYGCRALGYFNDEIFVDEKMTDIEIRTMLEKQAGFDLFFNTENGYEPRTKIVYEKVNERNSG